MKVLLLFLLIAFPAYSLDLLPPIEEYEISSRIGLRTNPMGGIDYFHKGVDLVGKHHAPVKAAAYGKVIAHWPPPNYYFKGHPVFGGTIIIFHGGGLYTLYGHLSKTFVHERDMVQQGQVIGLQGNTGKSTGEHLHFEVIIDPIILFNPDKEKDIINIILGE